MKLYFLLFICSTLFSQNQYSGIVLDSKTGEPLVGVNVQVKGFLEGTVSNEYGEYTLTTYRANPILELSYVGYKTATIKASNYVKTKLKQDFLSSDVVYVYGEGLSPAQRIILNTIDRYNDSFEMVQNFKLNTYAKQYFYFPKTKEDIARDDSLRREGLEDEIKVRNPYVLESYKEVNWKKPDKIKTTVLKRNQGRVLPPMLNVLGGMNYQNIFDKKFNLENSPLNRDGFDEYFYSIQDTILMDGDSTYIVHAVHNDTSNHWKYAAYISKDSYLLKHIKASYKHTVGRQYLNIANFYRFGARNVTLQQDYQLVDGVLFPKNFIVNHITRKNGTIRLTEEYSNYQTNILNLIVHFGKEQLELDSDIDEFTDDTWTKLRAEPLSPHEKKAYSAADSLYGTFTAWQRFLVNDAPSILFFDYGIGKHRLTKITDLYRFNPVEGHYLGIGLNHPEFNNITLQTKLGYLTGQERFSYRFSADVPVSLDYDLSLKPSVFDNVSTLDANNNYSAFEQSAYSLLNHKDKQNYLRKKGFGLTLQKRFTKYLDVSAFYTYQKYISQKNGSTFSLRNNGESFADNLQISDGREDEIGLSVSFKEYNQFKLGAFETNQFVKNGWDLEAKITFNMNDGDFSFKNIHFEGLKDYRFGRNRLQIKAVAHYKGDKSLINSLHFPSVYSLTSSSNNFHISGYDYYSLSSYDFYSIGASYSLNRLIPWFRPGTLYLNAMSFTGNNYGDKVLNGIKLIDDDIYHEFGIAFKTSRLFFPIRIMANYNTLHKDRVYKIDFSFDFD